MLEAESDRQFTKESEIAEASLGCLARQRQRGIHCIVVFTKAKLKGSWKFVNHVDNDNKKTTKHTVVDNKNKS